MTKPFRMGSLTFMVLALLMAAVIAPPKIVAVANAKEGGIEDTEPNMEPIDLNLSGKFLVQFKKQESRPTHKILGEAGVSVSPVQLDGLRGRIFNGTQADITKREARSLRKSRAIKTVERIRAVSVQTVQTPSFQHQSTTSLWNLDRINQRQLPLDGTYDPFDDGATTDIYIVDSGVNNIPGQFEGRYGDSAYVSDVAANSYDCEGHGTHVAGTAASTSYGAAKGSNIHSVRVLDCYGQGNTATILAGLNWVAENAQSPAIVNLSLGGPRSELNNSAVKQLDQLGILTVAASGNEAIDACDTSPGSAAESLTVSSSNQQDGVPLFSNVGPCVDLFAPGTDITSLSLTGQPMQLSGTSMAAPSAAGVAAILWEANPSATPAQIRQEVEGSATEGALQFSGSQANSPNLLLYVDSQTPSLSVPSKVKKLKAKKVKKAKAKTIWKAPKSNGGTAITKYETRIKKKGKDWKSWKGHKAKSGKDSYHKTWKKLKSGKKYSVQVRAKNAAGLGKSKKVSFKTKS